MSTPLIRSLRPALALVLLSCCVAASAAPRDLTGQWLGNSLLEGQREPSKTLLDLRDGDATTLRIESRATCQLDGGSATALPGDDGVALTFKGARGGEACDRLVQGKIVVRAGTAPRTLEFDVVYPGRDGTSNHRHGTLSRYP